MKTVLTATNYDFMNQEQLRIHVANAILEERYEDAQMAYDAIERNIKSNEDYRQYAELKRIAQLQGQS